MGAGMRGDNRRSEEERKRKRAEMAKSSPPASWNTSGASSLTSLTTPDGSRRSNVVSRSGTPASVTSSPSAAPGHDKRMSATLATQLLNARRSSAGPVAQKQEQPNFVAYLARQWAYTLGAELAQHVVGVFKDPSSSAYKRRWDSELANQVLPSNPWYLLPNQAYFLPPFFCDQVMARLPHSMQTIQLALDTVSHVVSRRNEIQHVASPEDVYIQIEWFKEQNLMRHLLEGDKVLHDFLQCDKLLADWFLGTPRIYRLAGQLLFEVRCSFRIPQNEKWADRHYLQEDFNFLEVMLLELEECQSQEWHKHKWPVSLPELASALDEIEHIDERFGPKLERKWRGVSEIRTAYERCVESGLLTPAVRRFCSFPCALLEKMKNFGLR